MVPTLKGLNIEESRPKSSITRLKPGWKWNPRSKPNQKTAQEPSPNPFPEAVVDSKVEALWLPQAACQVGGVSHR